MEKKVYLFVCDHLADWEPGLAIAILSDRHTEIPKTRSYPVVTFESTRDPVRTFGGLNILPDLSIDEIDPADAAMVILPGSPVYERDDPVRLVPLIESCVRNTIPVAAICGGTLFLAKHGFLDTIRHTSAGPGWLAKHAPGYRGSSRYVHESCVSDGGIITANPLGFVGFAYQILKMLDVFPLEFLEYWKGAVDSGYLDADSFA